MILKLQIIVFWQYYMSLTTYSVKTSFVLSQISLDNVLFYLILMRCVFFRIIEYYGHVQCYFEGKPIKTISFMTTIWNITKIKRMVIFFYHLGIARRVITVLDVIKIRLFSAEFCIFFIETLTYKQPGN